MNVKKSKRIAIFGGSFNPFHDGHYEICKTILKNQFTDEIWLTISEKKYFVTKKIESLSFKQKKEIIELYIKKDAKIKFPVDLEKIYKSYTYEILKKYQKKYPYCKFSLVIGYDQYNKFHKWKKNNFILNSVEYLYVIQRNTNILENKNINKKHNNKIKFITKQLDYSSTLIRQGDFLNLSKKMQNYINTNCLFWRTRLDYFLQSLKRIKHSENVAKLALIINKKCNLNKNEVFFAAIYHDLFKYCEKKDNFSQLKNEYLISFGEKNIKESICHGYIASNFIKANWGQNNQNILNAIKYHTMPQLNASLLDKIIFCADKCSYERKYKNILDLRKQAIDDVNAAFPKILLSNMIYLIDVLNIKDPFFLELAKFYFDNENYNLIKQKLRK